MNLKIPVPRRNSIALSMSRTESFRSSSHSNSISYWNLTDHVLRSAQYAETHWKIVENIGKGLAPVRSISFWIFRRAFCRSVSSNLHSYTVGTKSHYGTSTCKRVEHTVAGRRSVLTVFNRLSIEFRSQKVVDTNHHDRFDKSAGSTG